MPEHLKEYLKEPLKDLIRNHIRQNGPMSVATYWDMCLAHPQYGYYITRDPLGAAGDFVTAPEISQLFGEMIGIWTIERWRSLGSPSRVMLVECGPGRGTLMADLLRIARLVPEFLSAVQVFLVETSPALRARQATSLSDYPVMWCDSVDDIPHDAPLIVIGNEFLDALPIHQYVVQEEGTSEIERRIALGEDGQTLVFDPSDGQIVEKSPAREEVIRRLCDRITAQGGAALMIDYGHDVSAGNMGATGDTLQAVKAHQFCDVLSECGEADITSHVDFGRLADIVTAAALPVRLQGQGDFLVRMGITLRAAQLRAKSPTIDLDLRRLIDPDQMGTLFRVMEIG